MNTDETDADGLAGALAAHLDRLTFTDRTADQVTELILDAVAGWGRARGWRVYRRAASVVPLPPPYESRRSVVDVGCARTDGPPVVVEVDHSDRRRTLEKLAAEAAAGRVALWVRWGAGRFATPPAPVRLVPCRVTSRTALQGRGRVFSRPANTERPAPAHSSVAGGFTVEVMDPDVELVLRAYAAFAAGDIEGAVRDLHPAVEWIEPDEFPNGGRHVGPAAVARYLRASYDGWLELHSEPSATRRGDRIVVVHRVHGVLRDLSVHEATVVDVFTVAGGKVVRMTAYADPAQVPD
ncbi:nuclear transport factor 2 family protein [Dactylosporangium roseum]|uniref:Nuclear transport factor 2 family protein n=1 Tax=Dactylosporangium roseum TaxID=47989 RepID=A0ABY5ZCV9_9ACTN|nr:nuclear transport factor 2 family protein [Dactylosporangium roseum]UWZ39866.1 nuclear transport factor 2 family protein [Dactylosporangium roseum]